MYFLVLFIYVHFNHIITNNDQSPNPARIFECNFNPSLTFNLFHSTIVPNKHGSTGGLTTPGAESGWRKTRKRVRAFWWANERERQTLGSQLSVSAASTLMFDFSCSTCPWPSEMSYVQSQFDPFCLFFIQSINYLVLSPNHTLLQVFHFFFKNKDQEVVMF